MGTVSIVVRGATGAATRGASVSVDALLEADRDSATVYTVAAGREVPIELIAQPQRVRVTGVSGDRAMIEGLAPGARIVTRGAAYVTPGARVRIVTADTLAAALNITAAPAGSATRTAVQP